MASSQTAVRWGIIGPGGIAKAFAGGVAHSRNGRLVVIGARDPAKPNLAADFPGARILDIEGLLADPEVEAVYIGTHHPSHAEWAIKAAEAGKHVLCEKPMGLSVSEAEAMFHAAAKAGTFMGEAFMYRLHPQTLKLVQLIKDGTVGEVRLIRSGFGFAMPRFDASHRLYAPETAGGGILDVGCYPASMARLIAGAAVGRAFLNPVKVSGVAHLGASGVDEWASAVLEFEHDIIAEISCSISLAQDNVLRIFGTTGWIEVADFWFASGKQGGTGRILVHRPSGETETIEVIEPGWLYSFEADAASEAIRAGRQQFASPGMDWADTLGNLQVLDKWRSDVGLDYPTERPAGRNTTVSGRKLARGKAIVPKRSVPGLKKETSVVALGFEFFSNYASAASLLDAYYEAGGNLLDTAFVYGAGRTEMLLGQWLKANGVRDESVVIGKGAHSPLVYPDVIGKQLTQTLERLQTDHVDVYFMHRDNPDVPVGEFVDAMDAEAKAGRIRGIFGGSNWSRERMAAAIDYAGKNGKQKPGALSNNFSLAKMISPIWDGCIAASDETYKAFLIEHQLPNFSWSSQGRGFFTDRAGRGKLDNEEIVRCWYSDDNFARRDRAIELGQQLNRSPIHIALAYVLAQPFPSIPLIGPRTLAELEDSLSALDIKLTPEQVTWLEQG